MCTASYPLYICKCLSDHPCCFVCVQPSLHWFVGILHTQSDGEDVEGRDSESGREGGKKTGREGVRERERERGNKTGRERQI